jgi:hypothetical protein
VESGKTTMLLAVANVSPGDPESGWVTVILRELGRSQTSGFILDLGKWTLLGGFIGVLLAVCACVLFARLRWYDVRWRFARGLRWSIFAITVLLSTVLFGLAGFWTGAIRGSERVLTRSQLATEVFPRIGDVIADGMAWIQLRALSFPAADEPAMSSMLDEFRAGKWELHAPRFAEQLDKVTEDVVTDIVTHLEKSALEHTPQLRGGVSEKLLHELLNRLGRLLVQKKLTSELGNFGADRVYAAIRGQLTVEAERAGDRETISRSEISAFLVREGIVPGIMKPIRSTARSQQVPLVAIGVGVILVPPVSMRLARGLSRKRNESPTAQESPSHLTPRTYSSTGTTRLPMMKSFRSGVFLPM